MPMFISAMEGYRKTPDSIPVDDNKVLLHGKSIHQTANRLIHSVLPVTKGMAVPSL